MKQTSRVNDLVHSRRYNLEKYVIDQRSFVLFEYLTYLHQRLIFLVTWPVSVPLMGWRWHWMPFIWPFLMVICYWIHFSCWCYYLQIIISLAFPSNFPLLGSWKFPPAFRHYIYILFIHIGIPNSFKIYWILLGVKIILLSSGFSLFFYFVLSLADCSFIYNNCEVKVLFFIEFHKSWLTAEQFFWSSVICLQEYVIVLLKNGRSKDEAKNELDVFLGDDSDSFISWWGYFKQPHNITCIEAKH